MRLPNWFHFHLARFGAVQHSSVNESRTAEEQSRGEKIAVNHAHDTTGKLIDYLDQKLRDDGSTLPCSKEALRIFSSGKRGDVDCFDLINLDNESFRDAFYMRCFNVFPSQQFITSWEERIKQPKDAFQKEYVESLTKDPHFMHAQVKLHNCIYLDPSVYKTHLVSIWKILGKIYSVFKPLYLRLPINMRIWLKRRFR